MHSTTGAPAALDWSLETCTIGRAMAILGEKWTIVVLREVFNGIRRFDDMRVRTGVPRQVLANRLGMLVDQGVLRREPYRQPGARQRHEYRLTAKGFDLYPVLIAVAEWGDRYLAEPEGPPLEFVHRDCGSGVRAELHCAAGHEVADYREVVPRPGPGARRRPVTAASGPTAVRVRPFASIDYAD
jgi:DNA-binding HxlR family transcriptional regulator